MAKKLDGIELVPLLFSTLLSFSHAGCVGDLRGGEPSPDGGAPDARATTGTMRPPPTRMDAERCDDGADDDGDGAVDETCPCARPSEARACWPGDPRVRGVGACRDGSQLCEEQHDGEFGSYHAWGACMGATLPMTEIPGNDVDEDCDGEGGVRCAASEFGESCDDGRDDDCDGLVDCDDPECAASSATCGSACVADARGEACTNGVDDDCDGAIDCSDVDCMSSVACSADDGCPPGEGLVYRDVSAPPVRGGVDGEETCSSSISESAGLEGECGPSPCPDGRVGVQVIVVRPDFTVESVIECVPPPSCRADQIPDYQIPDASAPGVWVCRDRCPELEIQFGSIYMCERVCAPRPTVSCPAGQVPTFVYETRRWECVTECDGGLYDPHYLDPLGTGPAVLVCVPC